MTKQSPPTGACALSRRRRRRTGARAVNLSALLSARLPPWVCDEEVKPRPRMTDPGGWQAARRSVPSASTTAAFWLRRGSSRSPSTMPASNAARRRLRCGRHRRRQVRGFSTTQGGLRPALTGDVPYNVAHLRPSEPGGDWLEWQMACRAAGVRVVRRLLAHSRRFEGATARAVRHPTIG